MDNVFQLRNDNISFQDQGNLIDKLTMAMHPTINDETTKKLVEEEIDRRKKIGVWCN